MDHFGDYLRQAREARDIPIEQIAASTRISVRFLEALENEQFKVLPGGVFVISFVRQYARIVGLDEDEAVKRLEQVARPVESALGEWDTKATKSDDTGAKIAEMFTDFLRRHSMTLTGGLATVALLTSGFLFFQANEGREAEVASQPAETQPQSPSRQSPSRQTASRSPLEEAWPVEVTAREEPASGQPGAPRASGGIQLEVRLTDRAWVRVVADGERVLEDTLEAGFVQTIRANESVQLVVGNAGGVRVALNGETMQSVGPPGHVRRVDVSTSGMEVVEIEPKPASEEGAASSSGSQTEI